MWLQPGAGREVARPVFMRGKQQARLINGFVW